jgi:peptide/nickel transport system permease protein
VSPGLIARRIGLAVLTLWLVSLMVFTAVVALPGDAATAMLGKEATPERVAALRDQLRLDERVIAQYLHWLAGILTFDLGTSAATRQPVSQLLSDRVGNSAFLALIRTIADRVLVITDGRIVEQGPTEQVLTAPRADYTRRLLANTPSIDVVLGRATVLAD